MRPRDPRLRRLAGWTAALLAVIGVAAAVPGTSSAFTAAITNSADSASSKVRFTCADTYAGDERRTRAYFEFALTEPADATTAADSGDSGNPGTYRGAHGVDQDLPKSCPSDAGGAFLLDGSSSRISTEKQFPSILSTFSEEICFRTRTSGKLMGFESASEGGSSNYDKHLYVDNAGHLVFGIFNGGVQTLATPDLVTDGAWHCAVATTSAKGSALYLDGGRVASNEGFTTAESYPGYWRIGSGQLGGWPDNPSNTFFTGSVRFAAAYPYVLNSREVAAAWSIAQPGAAPTPAPTATATPAVTATPVDPTTEKTETPAPADTAVPTSTPTATPGPASTSKSGSTPIYQPAPDSSDISTVPDTQ